MENYMDKIFIGFVLMFAGLLLIATLSKPAPAPIPVPEVSIDYMLNSRK